MSSAGRGRRRGGEASIAFARREVEAGGASRLIGVSSPTPRSFREIQIGGVTRRTRAASLDLIELGRSSFEREHPPAPAHNHHRESPKNALFYPQWGACPCAHTQGPHTRRGAGLGLKGTCM